MCAGDQPILIARHRRDGLRAVLLFSLAASSDEGSRKGLRAIPATVAELGPGDSLGTGLAALLCGAKAYCGLDVKEYAYTERNVRIFDELVVLYGQRQPIPGPDEFPQQLPPLGSYSFPDHLLTGELLGRSLDPERLASIRREIVQKSDATGSFGGNRRISYFAPWHDEDVVREASIDMVFSQAVMEHVTDLDLTYGALQRWLKPGGWISHQIDFRCHHTANRWNGHWAYSDFVWRLIQGKRAYLLNRAPHSTHVRLLNRHGFQIVCDLQFRDSSGIGRDQLAARFREMSDDDLCTTGAFLQAVKAM